MKELANPIKEPSKNYSLMTGVLFWAGLVIMSSLYITIPLITTFTDILRSRRPRQPGPAAPSLFALRLAASFTGHYPTSLAARLLFSQDYLFWQ